MGRAQVWGPESLGWDFLLAASLASSGKSWHLSELSSLTSKVGGMQGLPGGPGREKWNIHTGPLAVSLVRGGASVHGSFCPFLLPLPHPF